MPGDLKVQLSHAVPDTKHRNVFMRTRTDKDDAMHMGSRVSIETTIHDGRSACLKLDKTSFELFRHPTTLATDDFYCHKDKVIGSYYGEMKELFAKATGSPHVLVFHHQIRNIEKHVSGVSEEGISTSTPVQPYAVDAIHTDSSSFHAEELFAQMVAAMPDECRSGRFMYINAWRNISDEPIQDNHLAVLDESTLVKPDDYIPVSLHGVGYDVLQYNLSCRNAQQHKWYYFPKMAKDEVLVFKQWDSDPKLPGRVCFHTAFKDPTALPTASPRQSIETRAFVFFPDHKPNTCPLPALAEAHSAEGVNGSQAEKGAKSLLNALAYIEGSPSILAMVVGHLGTQYKSGGANAVLQVLADDAQNHHGLQKANAETKANVVKLLVSHGACPRVDAWFAGPSPTRLLVGQFVESRVTAAALGATAVLAANAILKCLK